MQSPKARAARAKRHAANRKKHVNRRLQMEYSRLLEPEEAAALPRITLPDGTAYKLPVRETPSIRDKEPPNTSAFDPPE